jgi:F-type H+-transporting ATPase subunit b
MLDFSITFFITILNIGVLYLILRAILFKPVTKFMENRTQKIKGELEQAAREKERAEALRKQYEASIQSAEDEGERIIKEAREMAQKQAQTIVDQGKIDAENLLKAAKVQIEAERRVQALAFQEQAATLVLSATGRLLGREVNAEDAQKAAQQFVSELGMN